MANPAPITTPVRPDVLGRLLVIPSMLDVMPDPSAMAVFLGAALREVPGIAQVILWIEGVMYPSRWGGVSPVKTSGPSVTQAGMATTDLLPNQHSLPLASPRHQYGHLLLGIDDVEAFTLYEPYVRNIANIITTVLENRAFLQDIRQKNHRLQDLLTHLEERVEERTRDLTAEVARRQQLEQELRASNEQLELAASVFTHAREGILITDAQGTILDVNKAFTHITGYSREEVLGQNPRLLKSGLQEPAFYRAMWHNLTQKGYWFGEIWNRRKSGEVYAEMLTISAVHNTRGKPQRYVALFSNITIQKIHQQELEHIAHYDALTNLPNRMLLADRLHQAMSQAVRHSHRLAVVYLDLDGFKAINDTYGHEAGDFLLLTVASRMENLLREGDTIARLGGDEFVAVLVKVDHPEACAPIFKRLLTAAAQPITWGKHTLQVSASLGATFYPQADPIDADQLLRQADQAMYQAKLAGKNRYHYFDTEEARTTRDHHAHLAHIRKALAEQQFVLYYQPKVNMGSGEILGAEALIRWQHPHQGLLLPGQFLPILENHPLSLDLGEWVIDAALAQLERWHGADFPIKVSVNVGAHQLQQPNFMTRLETLLARYPHPLAHYLEIEVLETSALKDISRVSEVIQSCQALGVQFALDDFGTGYSSLTYLKYLPAAQMKIDQSFVRNMLNNPEDLAIIEGVIDLAQAFRRQVVAEGVETLSHGKMLLQLGCPLAQGYSIARPMPAEELKPWAQAWRTAPLWQQQQPLKHEDWPLLFAHLEISTWMQELENYLQGDRTQTPTLKGLTCCRLEPWLTGPGQHHYSHQPWFQRLNTLHDEFHTLGHQFLSSPPAQDQMESHARHLHALGQDLLRHLESLTSRITP